MLYYIVLTNYIHLANGCDLWKFVVHIQYLFFREGLRQLLPSGIELVSGPGCPVCVTDQVYMDKALEYAKRDDVIIATFGGYAKGAR